MLSEFANDFNISLPRLACAKNICKFIPPSSEGNGVRGGVMGGSTGGDWREYIETVTDEVKERGDGFGCRWEA